MPTPPNPSLSNTDSEERSVGSWLQFDEPNVIPYFVFTFVEWFMATEYKISQQKIGKINLEVETSYQQSLGFIISLVSEVFQAECLL